MRALKIILLMLSVGLSGCFTSMIQGREGVSSSLVNFLYPKGEKPPEYSATIPTLNLPLRVGLAFVPASRGGGLSEVDQLELLNKVKQAFVREDYIKEIVIIPDSYLRSGGGFETLNQVGRLYGVDVMALVSYDQVADITDNKASLFYWTIVGAYVIKGSDNAVQTFVDTAVFDLTTQKLLLRAPGTNRIESSSTLVNSEETLRNNKRAGFDAAVDDMNRNLATELERFKERIRTEKVANVTYSRPGGGGAIDPWFLLAAIVLAGLAVLQRRRAALSSANQAQPHDHE